MTNKYEQAAEQVTNEPAPFAYRSLIVTLLRAAARLPSGIDPVQVLEALWEQSVTVGEAVSAGPRQSRHLVSCSEETCDTMCPDVLAARVRTPPAQKQPTFPSPEEQARIFAATSSLGNPPAPAEDKNEREQLEQRLSAIADELDVLAESGVSNDQRETLQEASQRMHEVCGMLLAQPLLREVGGK